jgi:hypothetical protein
LGGTLTRAFSCYAIVPTTQTLPVSSATCLTQVQRACSSSRPPLAVRHSVVASGRTPALDASGCAEGGVAGLIIASARRRDPPDCRRPGFNPPAQSEEMNLAVHLILHHLLPPSSTSFLSLLRVVFGEEPSQKPKAKQIKAIVHCLCFNSLCGNFSSSLNYQPPVIENGSVKSTS